jgi:uncharacterized protein (TIGR02231 family)
MPVWAADIELKTVVDQVTVYPDSAHITRTGRFDLPAGSSNVLLKGLPASLDPASLRVEGQGTGTLQIGAVDVKLIPGDAQPVIDAALETTIKNLKEQRDKLSVQISALETKKTTIERYAQASPERAGPDSKPLDPATWNTVWDQVGQALLKVNEDLRVLKSQQRDVEAEIQVKERARPRPVQVGAPKRDVTIALETSAAASGTLRVHYRVSGASWQPIYDARLITTGQEASKPKLELTRRAQIKQRTGEEWTNVSLNVATTRANRGTAAPDLSALQVGYVEYRPQPVPYASGRALSKTAADEARSNIMMESVAAPAAPLLEDKPSQEQFAQLEAGTYQAQFAIAGKVNVPQDGASKTFALSKKTYEPRLSVKTVPVLDETAYLQAQFTNDEDATLLSGDVLLHRDESYIGKGRLTATPSGETVELGFGASEQVSVSRVPIKRRETDPSFLGSTKTDTREFKTTIKNGYPFAMNVIVQDRVPFSEVSTLNVDLLSQTTSVTKPAADTTPEPKDAKRGVMTWSYDLAPQESRAITFAYRIKWPADKELQFIVRER